MGPTGGKNCEKSYGDGVCVGVTQKGSGESDGIDKHTSEKKGIIPSFESDFDWGQWFFARLYDRKRDDLLGWFNASDDSVIYGVWKNTGKSDDIFVKIQDLRMDDGCRIAGVNWNDVLGDGLGDFICVAKDASVLQGSTLWKAAVNGYDQAHVRLADIDGDGRTNYYGIADNGEIQCWMNEGQKDMPEHWQDLGIRFTGKGMSDLSGVRFEDANGDGRDDWIWVSEIGAVNTWTKFQGCMKGQECTSDGLGVPGDKPLPGTKPADQPMAA
ncbi:Fc.00g103770.m01.CDS01 [Cosmosporella sp. VM-42]